MRWRMASSQCMSRPSDSTSPRLVEGDGAAKAAEKGCFRCGPVATYEPLRSLMPRNRKERSC
jgi:hypothetical protein